MRSYGFPSLLAGLAALLTAVPADAADGFRVLRSDATTLEVEITTGPARWDPVPGESGRTFRRPRLTGGLFLAEPGQPDVPSLVRLIAVPPEGEPRVRVLSVTPRRERVADLAPGPEPVVKHAKDVAPWGSEKRTALADIPGTAPSAWAEITSTGWMRHQRIARLRLNPYRYDASTGELLRAERMVVRVEFGEAGLTRNAPRPDHASWEEAMSAGLLNPQVAKSWRKPVSRSRGGGDGFSSSPNWLRIPIERTGVYRLDYFTFSNAGIDPAGIDPRTVRVFAGTNRVLEEEYAVEPPEFMTEVALHALDDAPVPDGIFDVDDVFLLFAHGTGGWAQEFDPALSRTDWVENRHTDLTYYWITWGGSFGGPPKRMGQRDVTLQSGAETAATMPWRIHLEENNIEDFRYPGEDGWHWEDLFGRGQDRLYLAFLDRVGDVGDGALTGRILSYGRSGEPFVRDVELKVAGAVVADSTWNHGGNRAQVDISGCFQNLLVEGPNAIRVNAKEVLPNSLDKIYTTWFDVEYNRKLIAESGAYLHFVAPKSPPSEVTPACSTLFARYGKEDFFLQGFSTSDPSQDVFLFDVTNQHDPTHLVGFTENIGSGASGISFSDRGQGGDRWYVATTMEGVLPPPPAEVVTLRNLRSNANGAEYLVIYHPDFQEGADRLAQLRSQALAGGDPFSTLAVSIDDIYNEFSWGMRDPTAIRDFLAYTLNNWAEGAPVYVTLIGDAAYDTKKFLDGSPDNLLGTYTGRYRTEPFVQYVSGDNLFFYPTDDFFAYADTGDYIPFAQPTLDFAIGRYPVSAEEDLDLLLDKLEAYLTYQQPGQWQNRIILTADDERTLSESAREPWHTEQIETLARERVPPSIDKVKVYLTEFPRNDFGKKPEAQEMFIDEFTRGALMVTYTGHGDQNTMAQEEVFVSQKIAELLNEVRYSVFSTFSCTVSRFDLLSGNSMTELLLLHPEGGAVTTFASAGLVFPNSSAFLNQEWLGFMFGTPYPVNTYARSVHSIGLSAVWAKTIAGDIVSIRQNSEKYVLLGDPALEVRYGRSPVTFETATVDSLVTDGTVRVVRGSVLDEFGNVLDGTSGAPAFNGNAYVHVSGQADTSGYVYDNGAIGYDLEGATTFRGQVPVTNGRFETKFFLSEAVQTGNRARISVFALEDGANPRDASGSADSLLVAPTISPGQTEDGQGPRIRIRFEGYDNFVDGDFVFTDKPVLIVEIEDESGINPLPFPEFAQLSAKVDDGEQIDLADDFTNLSGSFTQGQVRRILPLSAGPHTLEVKAFDNVGNRGSAEIRFTVVLPSADFAIEDRYVAVYPNPFPNSTDFLFRLTHPADVNLKIFTTSGREIYETGVFNGTQGDNRFRWDGHDERGRNLANGTYLYKLEASYTDPDGQLQSDEFVGHVVKMR